MSNERPDLVVRKRLELDAPDTSRGWTPLYITCAQGDAGVVEMLIKAGADQTMTTSSVGLPGNM
jgi:ankyrin repeat protein